MLFFIDESWQTTYDGKYKVGVLSAIQIKSHDFNESSVQIFNLKSKHLGFKAAREFEIKGKEVFKNYVFKLESQGTPSNILNFARELLGYMKTSGVRWYRYSLIYPLRNRGVLSKS